MKVATVAGKVIKHETLTETLALSECKDGFWLYDETRGMNLAMRCDTERAAFIEVIEYYQNRLKEVEAELQSISTKVNRFVSEFNDEA